MLALYGCFSTIFAPIWREESGSRPIPPLWSHLSDGAREGDVERAQPHRDRAGGAVADPLPVDSHH